METLEHQDSKETKGRIKVQLWNYEKHITDLLSQYKMIKDHKIKPVFYFI